MLELDITFIHAHPGAFYSGKYSFHLLVFALRSSKRPPPTLQLDNSYISATYVQVHPLSPAKPQVSISKHPPKPHFPPPHDPQQ